MIKAKPAFLFAAFLVVALTKPAMAQLIDRGNGYIYDADRNITWLQQANMAFEIAYDSDGLMTYDEARSFATWLSDNDNWAAGDNWRLPITPTAPDLTCSSSFNEGFGCTESEFGHLYYVELGNIAGTGGFSNAGAFDDIQTTANYWTQFDFTSPGAPPETITFRFNLGRQDRSTLTEMHYVWLVHDGDIAPQTECNDGVDNDGDGSIDLADPGCESPGDNDESEFVISNRKLPLRFIPTNFAIRELFREGFPWCPPGFPGCPGNQLWASKNEQPLPSYFMAMEKAIWKMAKHPRDAESYKAALQELRKVVEQIPTGQYFGKDKKGRLLEAIAVEGERRQKSIEDFLSTSVFVQSLNAIELDWRVPALKRQTVKSGKRISINLSDVVIARLTNVKESGEIELKIVDEYDAFPVASEYSPTWPFMTYALNFDGTLGPDGHLELSFYVKSLRLDRNSSSIRVLRVDEDRLVDVTTGLSRTRGTIIAKTDRPGKFIIVGRR